MLPKALDEDRGRAGACVAVGLFGLLSFAVYGVIAGSIGSDAWNGGQDAAGHCFLREHGRVTPVSHAVYLYSWRHTVLAILAVLAAMGAGLWLRDMQDRAKRTEAR
jgi:hypothetical protein